MTVANVVLAGAICFLCGLLTGPAVTKLSEGGLSKLALAKVWDERRTSTFPTVPVCPECQVLSTRQITATEDTQTLVSGAKKVPNAQCLDLDKIGGISALSSWEQGIAFELNHHSAWIQEDMLQLPMLQQPWFKKERLDKLDGKTVDIWHFWLCKKLLQKTGVKPKIILDHGAGPFSNLGVRLKCPVLSVDAQVVAVDPLSPAYNKILNKHGVHSTLRSFPCMSEDLTSCFCPDTFDLTIIMNALDHSDDAVKGWMNSVDVTKVGGLVCVGTLKNEAKHMGNVGFHQWNIFPDTQNSLIFEDMRSNLATNISDLMRGHEQVWFEHEVDNPYGLLRACWKKLD